MADREDTEDFTESEADTLHSFPGKRKYTKEEPVTDTDNFTELENKIQLINLPILGLPVLTAS